MASVSNPTSTSAAALGAATTTELATEKTSRESADAERLVATLDTDGTLAANSDTKVASQKAIKTYVDAKQGNLGSIVPVVNYTAGILSTAPGAKAMCFLPVKISQKITLTGITYEVGTVSSGKVIGAIYNSSGTRLQESESATQLTAEFFQRLPFKATLETAPGIYWLGLLAEGAATTFEGAFQMSPWSKATQGEFVTPASFTPPTELNNTGAKAPYLATY